MTIDELVRCSESMWFDRKQQFHINRVELLHDVLCLTNAYYEGDRYLLFGQADSLEMLGVESDAARMNNAQLHDFLRQCPLNRIPTLNLRTEVIEGHQIDVLHIKNRPDKPFFLTKDKSHHGRTLRGGVVYSRLGDTNTPMSECAPEDHVELMWRERFGLGLDPLTRFLRLLDSPEEWATLAEHYRYHKRFPEFTIQRGETVCDRFVEPWTENFPDPSAVSYQLEIRYLTTILQQWTFVSCDGNRYQIPLPERDGDTFTLQEGSPQLKLARQVWQYLDLDHALQIAQMT